MASPNILIFVKLNLYLSERIFDAKLKLISILICNQIFGAMEANISFWNENRAICTKCAFLLGKSLIKMTILCKNIVPKGKYRKSYFLHKYVYNARWEGHFALLSLQMHVICVLRRRMPSEYTKWYKFA